MYRSLAKRLINLRAPTTTINRCLLPHITTFATKPTTSTTVPIPETISHQNKTPLDQNPIPPPPPTSATLSQQQTMPPIITSHTANEGPRKAPKSEYQDEQAKVLRAALKHVAKLGWSEAALIEGAKEVEISPSIVGAFSRKEATLVEFFMDDCLQRLIDRIDAGELKDLTYSDRVAKLVRFRLEMQAPFISKWPQALSIQAQPMNVPTSFKQRAMLVDEIWHACGDSASDIDWYMKRTVLGAIYSAAEIYMLTDNSPGFRDTWAFLENRIKDAFDLGKTVQEASYLAEAVGAGLGSSVAGFMKGLSRG